MAQQLLLETPNTTPRLSSVETGWRLDDEVREVGRRGIADARAALAAARRPEFAGSTTVGDSSEETEAPDFDLASAA